MVKWCCKKQENNPSDYTRPTQQGIAMIQEQLNQTFCI